GRDGDTGADQPGQVTNTLTREQAPTLVVSTTAGNITTTAEHPFRVGDHWVMAGDLEAGNQLESQDGTPVTVTALTPTLEVATVYNLTIADLHTYYVTPERDRDDGTASTGL
ncbi:MAG: HINT domain-containing protein, partial [Bifidobacteriaceae bacterium]|nr:HINT domain-containing protein [Bifidobacteriaceae bacterium]